MAFSIAAWFRRDKKARDPFGDDDEDDFYDDEEPEGRNAGHMVAIGMSGLMGLLIERLAIYQGSSVAVASAKPVTFKRIAMWLDEAGRRGVSIAPVSALLIQ